MRLRIARWLCAVLLGGSVLAAIDSFAVTVEVSPGASSVTVSTPLVVDLFISGLAPGVDLGAFDLNVSFDAAVLGLGAVAFGTELGDPALVESLPAFFLVAPGLLNVSNLSLLFDLSFQPDAFALATLTFDTLFPGVSAITISGGAIPPGDSLSDASGVALSATFAPGEVTVTSVGAVPEPSGLLLLSTGLAGLTMIVRRRTRLGARRAAGGDR